MLYVDKLVIVSLLKHASHRGFEPHAGAEIESEKQLSIEHKIPWLDSENPISLFFDLENIAFSHLSCNSSAARPRETKHPSFHSYRKGCRCEGCKAENAKTVRKYRKNK
jgi:hypothetical protein